MTDPIRIPTKQENRRNRRKSMAHGAFKAIGKLTMADAVAARIDGITKVNIDELPWKERYFTPEKAAEAGLFTVANIGEKIKAKESTVRQWMHIFYDFPKPYALLYKALASLTDPISTKATRSANGSRTSSKLETSKGRQEIRGKNKH